MKRSFCFSYLSKYRGALMGLQILLIIIFHFVEDCRLYDVRYDGIIYLFDRYIHSSGVDIFLMLSGLGLYFSWKRRPEKKAFYYRRFVRILLPYMIVAIPAWLWLDIFYEHSGAISFVRDISFVSFFFEEKRWFWYILMACACYWIFPWVFEIVESAKNRGGEALSVMGLCTFSTVFLMMLQLYHKDLYSGISIAVSRFPAFFIGVWLGKAAWEKRTMPYSRVWAVFAVAVLTAWPLKFAGRTIFGVYAAAFLNFALCLVFVAIAARLTQGCAAAGLTLPGERSRGDGLALPERTAGAYKMTDEAVAEMTARGGASGNNQKPSRRAAFAAACIRVITGALGWFGKYTLELYLVHVAVRKVMKAMGLYTYRLSWEALMVLISVILAVLLGWISTKLSSALLSKVNF